MSSYIDRLKIHKDRICRSDVRSVDKGADSRGKAAYFFGFDNICDKFCFPVKKKIEKYMVQS